MARPRSHDKRNAILAAASQAFAEQGLSATTARIARLAGVAEGTVFTYFENKDVLLNELYLELKAGLRQAMMAGYPNDSTPEQQVRHAWNGYVAWGIECPSAREALRQLGVSGRIDADHRAAGAEGFDELGALLRERSLVSGLSAEQAQAFYGALFVSMAEASMEFIKQAPEQADVYRDAGFKALWAALGGR
ncbi:TetR/AcrR family transcriptional regulator [Pseudomonas sp. NC26]|uniref:TetR/AcrR family transcriptional regulator n=1 Tax=Pseudomonas putida TaxID=303 RepID=A0A7W2QIB6_PSEPU|nr:MULTISPECIES: TetR/AcrR family transcriptional regulator [Pseudomonas]MBA6115705.1 TetR/AcrR family transcriptional regulator [Pseudomonas putida]MCZ9638018.1 TetR/AcrR family transcriptional regulator [Pseudomonas putida]MEC4874112.1 TetR/AcrR family transcriptional regulator [Pseudomonas sp. NC26]QNL86231.1 AcrR family transcriptional regulator [Pseudomonas putida]